MNKKNLQMRYGKGQYEIVWYIQQENFHKVIKKYLDDGWEFITTANCNSNNIGEAVDYLYILFRRIEEKKGGKDA